MEDTNSCHVTLRLETIQHLFQAPDVEPLLGRVQSLSGIQQLLNELKPQPLQPLHTTVWLPPENYSEDLEQACRDAIAKYCEVKVHQITNEMVALQKQGWTALQIGLVFLTACLLVSTLVNRIESLPEFVRRLLSEGFVIAGWVGLWYPIELLLYDWWPYRRERDLHRQIRDMKLDIKTER